MKDQYVSVEHLLLGLDQGQEPRAGGARARWASAEQDILKALQKVRGGQAVTDQNPEDKYQALERVRPRPRRAGPARGRSTRSSAATARSAASSRCSAATDQEQPGADRRAGRRQDGDRRGAGPADRLRRRAREPARPQGHRPGHGGADRRHEVPRRVRGAAQGRAQGGHLRPRGRIILFIDELHLRRRRRQGRGGDGRGQPAQAGPGPRRAALHRRHHARRVPRAHREGPRPGAAVPAGLRRRAVGRGHHRDPPRPEGAVRGPPQGQDQGLGPGRRGQARRPLHHRPLPARQGDRPGRRGGQPAGDGAAVGADRDRRPPAPAAAAAAGRSGCSRRRRRSTPGAAGRGRGRDRRDREGAAGPPPPVGDGEVRPGRRAEGPRAAGHGEERVSAGPGTRSARCSSAASVPDEKRYQALAQLDSERKELERRIAEVESSAAESDGEAARPAATVTDCSRRRSTRRRSPRSSASGPASRSRRCSPPNARSS